MKCTNCEPWSSLTRTTHTRRGEMTNASYPSPKEWDRLVRGKNVSRRSMLKGSAAAGAVVAGSSFLAACGSDDTEAGTEGGGSIEPGNASGALTIGSNLSDDTPKAALAAVVAAFPNSDVELSINTTDHNTFQENINTILQAGEDDVLTWFAGFRNKFFADQGLLGDISDVWSSISGLGEGFKAASTASDGKQYFVPAFYYTWAINNSKKLWSEKGYTEPKTWDELLGLADDMAAGGITPFAMANDGKWPQMGMFDILNMRTNGYDFHVDLMGGTESWTDDRVRQVFTNWEQLLPYSQEGGNGRTWQEAATDMENGTVGMYLLGTFAASNSDAMAEDMDFFNFPEIDSAIGSSALDAPIDGYQMVASPANAEAAKEFLLYISTAEAQDAYLGVDPSVVASNSGADTSVYNDLQRKSADLANAATGIAQFLDRDTIPDFASACGDVIAEFIEDPSKIDGLLADLDEKKTAIFADFGSS